MLALFKKRKARSPSRTTSPQRLLSVKTVSDLQARQIYPVVLGVHVSEFTRLFEARCGDSSGEEGLDAPDELWKRGKRCDQDRSGRQTCADAQGFFFLKDSGGDVVVVGVQAAGQEVHLSFKNICRFMAQAEAKPGSTVWLAQRSLLASGSVNVQSLVQAQKDQEKMRDRDVCKSLRGVNSMRLAVMGVGELTATLKAQVPLLQIFGVPTFMTRSLSAINIENLLLRQFRTWLPQTDLVKSNTVSLFPIAASTLIILLETACSFEVLRRDLSACLRSQKEDAYKISYLLLWCLLVVLMVAHVWWVKLSLTKLVGGSIAMVDGLFSSLLSSMQAYLPSKDWGVLGVVLKQLWLLIQAGAPVNDILKSVFGLLGISGQAVASASKEMQGVIDDAPSTHPRWGLEWLLDKMGLVLKKIDSIMNSTTVKAPQKVLQTGLIVQKGLQLRDAASSILFQSWNTHLQELRDAMEKSVKRSGNVNRGSFEMNVKTLQPTLTFLKSLVELLTSLMLKASHEFREKLCSTGPSIGRSVSPASFVARAARAPEAKRMRSSPGR